MRPSAPVGGLSFSVVINTLDRADDLKIALMGLSQQRHCSFEIIVVDGPSTDATSAVLALFPQIRIGRCSEANLAKSRNIGVAMARGEIVAFLDDDAIPEPGWLRGLEACYQARDIGGVGGFIRDRTGLTYQARVTVCNRYGDAHTFETLAAATSLLMSGEGWFCSPTGANVSYSRKALLAVGGFDETFSYFLDETDVNLRLHDAGWRLSFATAADVHHKMTASAQRDHRNVPHSLYAPCRSKAYFALRHAGSSRRISQVLTHLADYGLTLREDNRRLAESNMIGPQHQARLDDDIEQGLQDGAARATAGPSPLLTNATLTAHDHGRFRPFRRSTSQSPLKIAFVSQQYPPGVVGGIGVWTASAARALSARGHEVSVITLADETPSLQYESGVWVYRITPRHEPARRQPRLPDLPSAVRDHAYAVYDALLVLKADRGLDIASWPIWDLEGLAAHAASDMTTIVSLHTTYALAAAYKPDWRKGDYGRDHVDKIIAAERLVLAQAPFVIANSAQGLSDVAASSDVNLQRSGVHVVPHGLSDRSSRPSRRRDQRVQILFVGRLEVRKGVDVLLDALSLILPRRSNVGARLIGEIVVDQAGDTLPQAFARRVGSAPWADRVHFEGAMSADALEQAYADSDIFVAPSLYESFGLVFVEAMMFAKPCIAARVGGVAEVVIDGVTGRLVEPGDHRALAQALDELIANPAERRRLGAAGRARYLAEFTDDRMALRLEAIFLESLVTTNPAHAVG